MNRPFLILVGILVLILGLILLFGSFGASQSAPKPSLLTSQVEVDEAAELPQPSPVSRPGYRQTAPKVTSLDPSQVEELTQQAARLSDSVLQRYESVKGLFKSLEERLKLTQSWNLLGPFSRKDFPEIVNGHQAQLLGNSFNEAISYTLFYLDSLKNPDDKERMENAIMDTSDPSLAVNVKPQVHFVRLTGRDARFFPKDMAAKVRDLWRAALVKETLLKEQRNIWEGSLRVASQKMGIEFPRWDKEAVFPVISSIDDQLMQNRKTYLGNLERLFREHGLLDDR